MVIIPVAPQGLKALVPQLPSSPTSEVTPEDTIVVQVLGAAGTPATYKINNETYARQDIAMRLQQIFSVRANKVMFIKGAADVEYGEVASMIDAGHKAGVDNIGIITPKVEAGQ